MFTHAIHKEQVYLKEYLKAYELIVNLYEKYVK